MRFAFIILALAIYFLPENPGEIFQEFTHAFFNLAVLLFSFVHYMHYNKSGSNKYYIITSYFYINIPAMSVHGDYFQQFYR